MWTLSHYSLTHSLTHLRHYRETVPLDDLLLLAVHHRHELVSGGLRADVHVRKALPNEILYEGRLPGAVLPDEQNLRLRLELAVRDGVVVEVGEEVLFLDRFQGGVVQLRKNSVKVLGVRVAASEASVASVASVAQGTFARTLRSRRAHLLEAVDHALGDNIARNWNRIRVHRSLFRHVGLQLHPRLRVLDRFGLVVGFALVEVALWGAVAVAWLFLLYWDLYWDLYWALYSSDSSPFLCFT